MSTAAAKQVYIAHGPGAGSWRRVLNTDIDYSDKSQNLFGWNDISDSQYTSGAPLSITSGVRTLLPNNGTAIQSDISRLGAIWSAGSSRFLIDDLNAAYVIRLNMRIKAAALPGTPYAFKMELESANGNTVIASLDQLIKGGNYENSVSVSLPFYMGPFINNQNLRIFVTPDTAVTVYDIGFLIQRTYREK